tara:strand:- start:653 stop:1066 length:414 start_codon:yes stop_codon:yes gene_type:complete
MPKQKREKTAATPAAPEVELQEVEAVQAPEAEEEEVKTEETEPSFQEVVEVPWDEVEQVINIQGALREAEEYTSSFLLNAEKRKTMLFSRMAELESTLYQQAQEIKAGKNLNPNWTFELKLPEKPGEKAYFVRKEET